ncbi:hypothetical protein CERSUDRAFT_73301 [Gelatoporia subvermispora B]|uniref:Uncharacterized protein n=1 Tax=Ceriporiopsis subvermispora (strain B) TaxID=914234 RepID=M2PLZ8_CERS8|nr:hypothetical protein CERSUDRAFT_73301 [Gelatoporia subvermispora B]
MSSSLEAASISRWIEPQCLQHRSSVIPRLAALHQMDPSICAPPNPSGRNWTDIVRSCTSVIVLSVWQLQRPNIVKGLGPTCMKLLWALLTAIAPDILLVVAVWEYSTALQVHQKQGWEMSKCYLATTGCFTIAMEKEGMQKEEAAGEYVAGDPLTIEDIRALISQDLVSMDAPYDSLIKPQTWSVLLACLQGMSFIVQCMARGAFHLPMTTLEYGTIIYVFIAVAVYILYKDKQPDVSEPLPLPLTPKTSFNQVIRAVRDSCANKRASSSSAESSIPRTRNAAVPEGSSVGPVRWWLQTLMVSLLCIGSSLFFGLLHLLAWNIQFPTKVEHDLWLICSIISAFGQAIVAGLIRLSNFSRRRESSYLVRGRSAAFVVFVLVYVFPRAFLFFEMFYGLRCTEAGVWDTTSWTQYLPFI